MKLYLVGGAVRDRLLHLPICADEDWVVVGSTPEAMLASGFKAVGRGFPVFIKPGFDGEYALARTERKVSHGYRGFTFNADPRVTLEEDLRRRDLTVNAVAYDESQDRYIDPYGGMRDIEKRLLRHVSEAFSEDPVRVLRVARFAARFSGLGFKVDRSTRELMKQMVWSGETEALTPERVWKEMQSALREDNSARFFEELEAVGALSALSPDFVAFSKTDCYRSALAALASSGGAKVDVFERFLLLALSAGACSISLTELCRNLKMPGQYCKAAESVRRLYEWLKNPPDSGSELLLKIVECFDGIRNPERLRQLVHALTRFTLPEGAPCALEKVVQLKEKIMAAGSRLSSLELGDLLKNAQPSDKPGLVKAARHRALLSIAGDTSGEGVCSQ